MRIALAQSEPSNRRDWSSLRGSLSARSGPYSQLRGAPELEQRLEHAVVLVVVGEDHVVDHLGQIGHGEPRQAAERPVAHHRIEEDGDRSGLQELRANGRASSAHGRGHTRWVPGSW